MNKIYEFTVEDQRGELIGLDAYQGKVLLIMNSATKCNFTAQYDELQDLYEKYAREDFIILDFPCNQFDNQAPGSNEEIAAFCDAHFGIGFPIFSKVEVNGENATPLFRYLVGEKGFEGFHPQHPLTCILESMLFRKNPNYENEPDIKWNFTKFLVDREGAVVRRFEPTEELYVVEEAIKELL